VSDRASVLRAALQRRRALVAPGCHDALSAKIIEHAGFEAVQISGFGVAGSLLGKPDVGLVDMKDVLDITAHIIRAVGIPVMADIDTGALLQHCAAGARAGRNGASFDAGFGNANGAIARGDPRI